MSHFKEEERNGAGERKSGTAPGRPAGAKIFADWVRNQDNLPATLSKLRSNTKKKSQTGRRAEKKRLVIRGEELVGPTDEEASTERVS